MTLVTTGLKNGGVTTHYTFSYDDSFASSPTNPTGPEPARTNAVIKACENDYNWMSGLFGRSDVTGMTVQVIPQNGVRAGWSGSASSSTIQLYDAQGTSFRFDPNYLRYLIIAEVTEIFMLAQNTGWFQSGNEGSKGEGLSRFLSSQFLAQNGLLGLGIDASYAVADLWLNVDQRNGQWRQDYVNNAPDDFGYNATNGCTTLFIYYMFHQLGFSITQIVGAGASTLAGVYRNLTGDTGDPFPFFKHLLDDAFPSQTGNAVPGPNFDDPWPLGKLTFVVDKNTFGKDEVTDQAGWPNAFWLTLEGFNRQVLGNTTPNLSGPASTLSGVTLPPEGTVYERPGDQLAPQLVSFPFDVNFSLPSSLGDFPSPGNPSAQYLLNGSISVLGTAFTASTVLELVAGADPYFTNIDPTQNNVFWLSQDLRVFTATPGLNNTPVPGAPPFTADSFGGAFAYIQSLLPYLNTNYSNPNGTDPFNDANNVIPGQTGVYTGDSSVTPSTNSQANYNFAIARVRLRGSQGVAGQAQNVRVFFRLWSTQTADTDYLTATYPSHPGTTSGLPDWPLPASDSHTIPFFATSNTPNFSDPNNPEFGTNGINNKTIIINSGDSIWAYFGCFLNVYDPSNIVNGSQVQALLTGTHHCLVAQIAYDSAPIVNSNGVTESPENSDKLAQRNLQVTSSANPGVPATHLIPQTFDLRPSLPPVLDKDVLLQYPDELMIDWGNTPLGSTATIYWPQVNASDVVGFESRLYGSHLLTAADANTVQYKVTGGVTYVPIPSGSGQNFAGLLTIELPPTVVKGQEFNVIIRRITTRRFEERGGQDIGGIRRQAPPIMNWRYVIGTFQVRIPVSTADTILPAEENTLAIFKWRLQAMSPTNRWYPVLVRYVSLLSARVEGLGGNPNAIPPSLSGAPPEREVRVTFTGKIAGLIFDRFGDFEGFLLDTEDGERKFFSREKEVEELTERAWRERLRIVVYAERDEPHRPLLIIVREPPAGF